MNITTFNINSIRARMHRLLPWIDARRPDVLCLQELKCLDAEVPVEPLLERGYFVETFGQKTYNGVAILSRLPLEDVRRGIPNAEDPQSRGITARVGGVRVLNLYVPNGGDLGSEKYPYKLDWLDRLIPAVRELATEPLVVCGDFNIGPTDDDVWDPANWQGQVLVSEPERERFRALLALGLTDSLRALYPQKGVYTWWDYRGNGYALNNGLRIDHFLLTGHVMDRLLDVTIDREERGQAQASDHAPVTLHLADR